jgi:carboxyl-terminal processing protease
VQTVYPLEDGSGLRLTTALYYTPGGRSIQETGITPDIVVAALQEQAAAPDTEEREGPLRERDLERHFLHEKAAPDEGGPQPAPLEVPAPGAGAKAEPGERPDVQLARGLEVLKSWTYFERLRGQARAPVASAASQPAATP